MDPFELVKPYEICGKCFHLCHAMRFQQSFKNWTSGNDNIDKFIQDIQLSEHNNFIVGNVLEWIPYDRFHDIKYISKDEFGGVYRANWIDGNIGYWNYVNQNWERNNLNMFVNLKSLNTPNDLTFELANKVKFEYEFYGITQNPDTKNYMMVLNNKCKKCNKICNAIHFQQKFIDWTSGNDDIDKFIQDTQLSAHNIDEALEWIPYDRFYDIKYVSKDESGEVYRANWIDGNIICWNYVNQNWERKNHMFVNLKSLNTPNVLTFELINKIKMIKIEHEINGITRDPETKNYIMVWSNKCKECNCICYAKSFQQNFKNWTSGSKYVDRFIQDTQLSAHNNVEKALEWIPYDRFYDNITKDEFGKVYRAIWIDGNIRYWDDVNQNWERNNTNMFVNLRSINALNNLTLEFANMVKIEYEFYGMTQDPGTKNYMMVLNNKCKKCDSSSICNAIHFQHRFIDWTSGNNVIDKFIQDTQLSTHDNAKEALEWIPYDRFYNIEYIAKDGLNKAYRANWIDGNIRYWDNENQNWKRGQHNMIVSLKSLNAPEHLTLVYTNKIKIIHEFYGITRDTESKDYMMVLSNRCNVCNEICNAMYFCHNFENWTSGNNKIDEFIQYIQLSEHNIFIVEKVLEWIPYDRFYDSKYTEFSKVHRAIWIDGNIRYWNDVNQNWERNNFDMFVNLRSLIAPNILTLEFVNKIKIEYEFYGITQDPETKNYMMVLNNKCKKCDSMCNAINFQHKFIDWTSGNDVIDKFIQDTQLSAHYNAKEALEWIPYNRLCDIKYIEKDKFGNKVYGANWIDGNIKYWYDINQNWKRDNLNMFVNLKSLDTPNNLTLEFINKVKISHKFYGITQDPITENYMIVLDDICEICNVVCNTIYFKRNFKNWTSGNDVIDKFIQDTQLSAHYNAKEALEWIPYDRFYDIKYISKDEFGEAYRAKWRDGNIDSIYSSRSSCWDDINQDWKRNNLNMFVNLKRLNTPNDLTFELANKIKYEFYGITQDPETKDYMMVLNNKCEKCYKICNAIHFQHRFIDWISGNNNIDKFIQDAQLSAHDNVRKALEWIPYDRFNKYISKDEFGESLNVPEHLTLVFTNKIKIIHEFYGITQDTESKEYLMVLSNRCNTCNKISCNAMHFCHNFESWTSGNNKIDEFIQDVQLLAHYNIEEALEWIPYDRLYNIKCIAKDESGANWSNGNISCWDDENQNWKRECHNIFVNLKGFNTSNCLTLEYANKIKMEYVFYGITQDPKTENYMMVLDNNVRSVIIKICNSDYSIHFQQKFIDLD
ncbi:unnamed protein product [Rhizophagus irregularis]|nr:unnamed protein product [Rhizophagus irregularis]